jgi:lipopolysaccharide/colanic/teichoic acid biosynthesis glycosyltransferase
MSIADPGIREVATAQVVAVDTNSGIYRAVKPALDFALALVLLAVTSPITFLAMILVRMSSRGSPIFTQTRLGLGGRIFRIYKIRTMYKDSERTCGPKWCLPGDSRVTPVGRFLRWSHIDELPQLINVLWGEMSLVGPRPERPEFLEQLERALPDYRRRLTVRPGITGLAQVLQAADTDLSTVRRKLNYDLHYVEAMNLWLDLRLLIGTAFTCLGVPFTWIGRTLQLPDPNYKRSTCTASGSEPSLPAATFASESCVG